MTRNNRWAVGGLVAVVVFLATCTAYSYWRDNGKFQLNAEQKKKLAEVEERYELCAAFARSQGLLPASFEPLVEARKDLQFFREGGDEKYLKWVDSDLSRAYHEAHKPGEIAEMYGLLQQAHTANMQKGAPDCQDHLHTAKRMINLYARWDGQIPQMVREEVDYVIAVSNKREPKHTRLTRLVDSVVATKQRLATFGASYRIHAHGKQGARFFEAWLDSGTSCNLLLNLAEAELDYVQKIAANEKYVITGAANDERDPANVLLLVDRFAASIEAGASLHDNPVVEERLNTVRATFDWTTKAMVERRHVVPDTWTLKSALEDCEREIQKARAARPGQRFMN